MFNIGDKVKFITDSRYTPEFDNNNLPDDIVTHGSCELGKVYEKEFAEIIGIYEEQYAVRWTDIKGKKMTLGFEEDVLKLINNNNKTMTNVKEKFVTLFIKEPEKTFRKAGITNGDGFLTEEGQSVFLGYLLNKHGVDFKAEVVDEIVKEEKGDK